MLLKSDDYKLLLRAEVQKLTDAAELSDFTALRLAYDRLGELIPSWSHVYDEDERKRQQDVYGPIASFEGVGLRVLKVFKEHGVRTKEDLDQYTDADLLKWPNFGRFALNQLRAAGLR